MNSSRLEAEIFIRGLGAVSPAGWNVVSLFNAIDSGKPLPAQPIPHPQRDGARKSKTVPPPDSRPSFLSHARLRRTSPITQYAVASGLEAMGDDGEKVRAGKWRLGIVLTVMSGCVNYSRRFYDETLKNPGTASPLVFPETVFNAPASHIAAILETTSINYTLVGDPGTFLQGLALGANWLVNDQVDGALVIGAEEMDWLTADAFQLFSREIMVSEGAGAIYLSRQNDGKNFARLRSITSPQLFVAGQSRARAAAQVCAEIGNTAPGTLLCDSRYGLRRTDLAENFAWAKWAGPTLSPKRILGEGLMAGAAWQCVIAAEMIRRQAHNGVVVSVVGCNQQAIGAAFSPIEPVAGK